MMQASSYSTASETLSNNTSNSSLVHPVNYSLNSNMFHLVSYYEGARHYAYNDKGDSDPTSNCTIGIGHKLHNSPCTTQDRARYWSTTKMNNVLRSDLNTATQIRTAITRRLSLKQYYAVLDVTYVAGVNEVSGS
jgi:GH24 family phage-related lysozyme (muramidase)